MTSKNESFTIEYAPIAPISQSKYPGFNPSKKILKKGTVIKPGRMPLPCDVLMEQDVAVTLRDGTKIYTDIYRPVTAEDKIPAIVVWAPYGKQGTWFDYDAFVDNRMGIHADWEDGLNEFEGPNPSWWVKHGYAVLQPDPRGIFNSEGDVAAWGTQEGQDEYDFIEWTASQPWCNGKIGLTGNSWLSMAMWNVSSLNPPHLTAIAPWEGTLDNYREDSCKGGIPDFDFCTGIFTHIYGNNRYENLPVMISKYPFDNAYWKTKCPDVSKVTIPAYVAASYTNMLHTRGSFDGFNQLASKEKWLRIHTTHEWHDYYTPENQEDLRRFFDHYLKSIDNGWENTPKVRMSVLDAGHENILYRPEASFPLQRQQLKKFYLDAADCSLRKELPASEASKKYASATDGLSFTFTVPQDIEVDGYIKLHLYVAAEAANDADIFAYVRKQDEQGKILRIPVINGQFAEGASGRLRLSMREEDPQKSTEERPYHCFTKAQPVRPGEIVPINIEFWPTALKYHAGEKIEVFITGNELLKHPEFPGMPPIGTINQGNHIIYTGGQYASYIQLPLVRA